MLYKLVNSKNKVAHSIYYGIVFVNGIIAEKATLKLISLFGITPKNNINSKALTRVDLLTRATGL